MSQFPQLIQADMDALDGEMRDLLRKSEANLALLVEKAGYLIHQCGSQEAMDSATFATLGSNAFNAVQFMAQLVNEGNFTSMYQQGERYSTLMLNVDENALLVLVFPTHLTLGSVKYYATPAALAIGASIRSAAARVGANSLDLSDLDPLDISEIFREK
jgi:predicted regulator of Ras-like GTPase activity (Roadblock/LC7/MglB family)